MDRPTSVKVKSAMLKSRALEKELKKERKFEKALRAMKDFVDATEVEGTSKPKVKLPKKGSRTSANQGLELSTLSIAIPGSILENAQSAVLQTYLAGQIARAACIYNVHEVVVFDDMAIDNESNSETSTRHCCTRLARILQYLECPQYLRKHIFPIHDDLEFAGVLNPLDGPHHLRQDDDFTFRDGIVSKLLGRGDTSRVNVGLLQEVQVDRKLPPGLRVTVQILPKTPGSKKISGIIVPPSTPQLETGKYWGYTVRIAKSISTVISQSPYKGGYDVTIGTSDKGNNIDELSSNNLPKYNHALVVFGGLHGLELAMQNDPLQVSNDPSVMFDYYLNVCPTQGSRTIRTEEAVLIALAELRKKFLPQTSSKVLNN